MRKRAAFPRLLLAALLGTWLWPAAAAGGSLPRQPVSAGRVSERVMEATAGGAMTDFMIVLAEQADLAPAYSLPTRQAKGRFVRDALWETAHRGQAPLRGWLDARGIAYRPYYIVNLIQVEAGDRALVEALARRPDVARIEANPTIRNALPQPAVPMERRDPSAVEPNISHVGAPEVWALGYTGQDVVVGGQDTGYQWDHPALKQQYRGWNGTSADHDYNWHDAIHSGGGICGADSPVPCDDHGHGTHTMGTVLGDDGSTHQVGMAPGARWIGCRNMNQGYGTPATYLECFEFFLAPYPVGGDPGQGDPDLAPDVTNNSWSCPPSEGCSWPTLQAAVEAQRAAGIMTVVSAGNNGPGCGSVNEPPSLYDAAYSVGATYLDDTLVGFSSRGPVTADGSGRVKPDLTAPGSGIVSSTRGGGYGSMSGTSMAAPHVAGAAALLWSAVPCLAHDLTATEAYLNENAVHIPGNDCSSSGVPNNLFGWGRLDVLAAVQAALRDLAGELAGTVRDELDNPLEGARIEATRGGLGWETAAGAGGQFSLPLPCGAYDVVTSLSGYRPFKTEHVQVTARQTTTLHVTLAEVCDAAVPAGIEYSPAEPQLGAVVTLTGTVYAGSAPISYTWDFGDGSPLAPGNPVTHTFPATRPTSYTVTLQVSNRCGEPASISRAVQLSAPPAEGYLAGRIRDDQADILYGAEIEARAGPMQSWRTTSGCGGRYRLTLPAGSYTVTAGLEGYQPYQSPRVEVAGDQTTALDITLIRLVPCEAAVPAGILFSPAEPRVGQTITLTGIIAAGRPPFSYTWDLGDGSPTRLGNPVSHTFPRASTPQLFTVTLTVDNRCQEPAAVQQPIWVRPRTLYAPLVFRSCSPPAP